MFQEKIDKHQGEISSEKSTLPPPPQKNKTKQELGGKKALAQRANNQETKWPKRKGVFSEKVET